MKLLYFWKNQTYHVGNWLWMKRVGRNISKEKEKKCWSWRHLYTCLSNQKSGKRKANLDSKPKSLKLESIFF